MKKALNGQGLLYFTWKHGEEVFDGVDLSNITLRTGGMDSQFMHMGRGYGFIGGEGPSYGKGNYKNYETIDPWFSDFISFCHRKGIQDVVYVANTLTEDFGYNRTVSNNFEVAPTVDLYAIEIGNEPYDKEFDQSFYKYYTEIETYLRNSSLGITTIPMENRVNRKYADSVLDLVQDDRYDLGAIAIHKYFDPNKLTEQLDIMQDEVALMRERTGHSVKVMLTETNIHNSFIKTMSNNALWDCWVEMYERFEAIDFDLVCHHNLASLGVSALIDKHGPRTKSDGTPLVSFFT